MVDGQVPAVWRPGEVILGLYEVRDVIRSGGMGLVYRVLHRGWNVELAVKAPRPELVATEKGLRDFEAEAATWVASGEHPHTANCVYVRRLGGVPRVFAEWLDGGSLAEAVREGHLYAGSRREALRRILDIAVQTAWGLQHAHQHGLVHQDVKPANVLLDGEGTAKVTDFGLARARAAAGESTSVPPGASVLAGFGGMTPAYCSPEQAEAAVWTADSGRPRTHLTRATDTWSWALTVLEMFVGRPPSRYGQTGAEAFAAYLEDRTSDRRAAMPDGLAALLGRCFAHDPAVRPRDMGELAGEVAAVYAEACGEPYPRPEPQTAAGLADELSNEALSMLDLGHSGAAEELWQQAVEADPHNPHAVYNRGLHLWRAGQMTDAQLIGDLVLVRAAHPEDATGSYLLGLVHLERGDTESARQALREAASGRRPSDSGDSGDEITAALDRAESAPGPAPPRVLTGHSGRVNAVALSQDGQRGVSASSDGTVRVWDLVAGRGVLAVQVTDGEHGVISLAIDGAGHRAVTSDYQGPAQIWDLRTGQLGHTLTHADGSGMDRAFGVAMSVDGRLVLTAHGSGAVRVWDAGTGRYLRTLAADPWARPGDAGARPAGPEARSVALSADGRLAFVFQAVGPSPCWEPRTGELLGAIDGDLSSAVLSADGRTVVSGEWPLGKPEGFVHVRDVATRRRRIITLPGPPSEIFAVSADGSHALFAQDPAMELWETTTGRCLHTWLEEGQPTAVALGADGRTVLVGAYVGTLTVRGWTGAGPAAAWSYPRPRAATDRLRESGVVRDTLDRVTELIAQGRLSAAAQEIRRARAIPGYRRHRPLLDRWYDVAPRIGQRVTLSGAWLRDIPLVLGREPRLAARRAPLVLSRGTDDGGGKLWDPNIQVGDLREGRQRHLLEAAGGGNGTFVLSDDGRIALSAGGRDGTAQVWDVERERCVHVLRADTDRVGQVAVSGDGRVGLTAHDEGIRVWDLVTGEGRGELIGHTDSDPVFGMQMSADGRLAFSWGYKRMPRIWDVQAGTCRHVLQSPEWGPDRYALSRAGNVLLSSHQDGTVKVWDTSTGQCRHALAGHERYAIDVAVSADGRTGVCVSMNGTMRIWDLVTGECRHTVRKAALPPSRRVVLSADDRFAVTGGGDGLIRVWDLRTGACLGNLEGHRAGIMWLGICGDDHFVTSIDDWHVTHVWELDWEYAFPGEATE